MKRSWAVFAILGFLFLSFSIESFAQELPYTEGSVWQVTFVKTKPGMGLKYLKNLQTNWKKVLDEGKKEDLILSYKILSGSAATRDDWDLMLMVELKNMAALDGLEEKFMAIANKTIGPEDEQDALMTNLGEIRKIMGSKITRELIFK
ncbi:MAG: hypothetical protein ACE5OP_06970 [Candidatus Glassbacteria bacterium]